MSSQNQRYRLLTYAFVHADWMHLAFNMFVLYNFGSGGTEAIYKATFGTKGILFFILLYVGGIITSVIQSVEKNKNNYSYSAVGASGAVSAVVFAFILFYPLQPFYIMFIPIPIPAYIFGALYLIISFVLSRQNKGNIGHDAHFYGAIFGLLFTILLDKKILTHFIQQLAANWA